MDVRSRRQDGWVRTQNLCSGSRTSDHGNATAGSAARTAMHGSRTLRSGIRTAGHGQRICRSAPGTCDHAMRTGRSVGAQGHPARVPELNRRKKAQKAHKLKHPEGCSPQWPDGTGRTWALEPGVRKVRLSHPFRVAGRRPGTGQRPVPPTGRGHPGTRGWYHF